MMRNATEHNNNTNSSSISSSTTRIESFRSLNRNRPWKQWTRFSLIAGVCVLYIHLLLVKSSPGYNFDQVYHLNAVQKEQYKQKLQLRHEEREARRKERLEQLKQHRREEMEQEENETSLVVIHSTNGTTITRSDVVIPMLRGTTTSGNNNNNTTTSSIIHKRREDTSVFADFLNNTLAFLSVICFVRLLLRACLLAHLRNMEQQQSWNNLSRSQRQARFRAWVTELNQHRQAQGEGPLSMQTLQTVLREADLSSGNDYNALLNFGRESGPALQALLRNVGATREEIERCPQRVLREGDDLLLLNPNNRTSSTPRAACAICLEEYEPGQVVRTIPCFHSFHTECIDRWLLRKAVCPVCKHPAVV